MGKVKTLRAEKLVAGFSFAILILLFLVAGNKHALAQTTTATLSGNVTDDTGAVLPNAHAVVMNTDTGVQRTVSTDEKGFFRVAELPPGPYQVNVSLAGFETLVRKGITLAVGQSTNVAFAMKVGAVSQQLTVTAEAPLVNTSTSAVAGVVEEKRIEELPLNGRDFSQLPLVQPGVTAIRNADVTVTKGYGARISIGGSRPDQTAWLLDGTNIRNSSNFGTPGSAAGVMLGVDAVREFQVLTSNYSAEVGGTSGGVINMVTKSGTNALHGSVYEYLRNSDLDARNFFDQVKPSFKRNQFGGSVGGPIKKDRTFFFGNYEGLRQRQGVTQVATVPDLNVHRGLIPAAGGGLQQVAIAPEIQPYLNLYPLANGPSKGGGIATLFQVANSPVREDYFVVRVDHHINDKQSIFARFTLDQGKLTTPDAIPITQINVRANTRYTTVQHDYIATPSILFTTRLAGDRTLLASNDVPVISYPSSLNIFLAGWLPNITLPGISALGPSSPNLALRAQNLYDIQENVQIVHGGHAMKFGVQIDHVGANRGGEVSGINGNFGWSSIQDFLLDNKMSSFAGSALGADTYRSYVQYIYASFFQDDWKMRPNFTWNLGLRYEPYTVPTEKHNRISMLQDWIHATAFDTTIPLFSNPSKKAFSPRVGFAWDPSGNGKTAVRAGLGVFFVDILVPYYGLPGQKNAPFDGTTGVVLGNLASAYSDIVKATPALASAILNPNTFLELIQNNLNPSYEVKVNFTVERQLPGQASVSLGYTGSRGIHLWRESDVNDVPPITVNGRSFVAAGTPRANPNAGVGTTRYSDARSFYNGLQIEGKKRFSHGFQFQSSYTWSKNVDDGTTGIAQTDFTPGGVGITSQPFSPKADRALSSLNVRQILVINGIYAFPSPGKSGFSSALLGGWQLASIFSASSGVPFTVYVAGRNAPDQSRQTGVQHPDLVAGRKFSSIVTGNPNGYIDTTAFVLPPAAPPGYPAGSGFYGNAGRNILTGPGLTNIDFSLQKTTRLGIREGTRLEFHADFFNLLNRANFANPRAAQSQVLNATTRAYISGAGQITNTVTSSRQIQLGLKLIF